MQDKKKKFVLNAINMKMFKNSISITMAILFIFFFTAQPAHVVSAGEYKEAPEQLIKAAYLYKFLYFINWSDSSLENKKPEGEFTIGILGEDPFGEYFQGIEGRDIKSMNRKIKIKRLGSFNENIDLTNYYILFICSSEKNEISNILRKVKGSHVLTVSDSKGFLDLGVIINLVNLEGRVRWELNLAAAKQSDLIVSSALIQSAVKVLPAP